MLWNAIIKNCVHYFFFIAKECCIFALFYEYCNIYIKMLTAIKSGPRSCGQMYDVR